jgi:hypothetical protein
MFLVADFTLWHRPSRPHENHQRVAISEPSNFDSEGYIRSSKIQGCHVARKSLSLPRSVRFRIITPVVRNRRWPLTMRAIESDQALSFVGRGPRQVVALGTRLRHYA